MFITRDGIDRLAQEAGKHLFIVVLLDHHRFTAVMLK
jgi:hypothetical protein